MAANDQELEVKYLLADPTGYAASLRAAGAQLEQARVFEQNLRFDTPSGALRQAMQVLRLRADQAYRLTFKGPGAEQDGVRLRQEIEFELADFAAARRLLEALGYQVVFAYEKYRTTYLLDSVLVTLDEMPYGVFSELEGSDPVAIRQVSARLGLAWEARILDSYTLLFEKLRLALNLGFTDLTFANFVTAGIQAPPARPLDRLGLPYAGQLDGGRA